MSTKDALTARQRNVLDYVIEYQDEHGFPPSMREIGEFFKIRSTNGVSDHLRALERKGWLVRNGQQSRGLSIQKRPDGGQVCGGEHVPVAGPNAGPRGVTTMQVPVLGRVAAGVPLLAVEQIERTITIDPSLIGGGGEVFGLRVEGRSMIGAGILPGDLVFVRRRATADNGRIAVVMIDGEATVKRFYREADHIRLQAENPDMAPIIIDRQAAEDCQILGEVVGVWRQLR